MKLDKTCDLYLSFSSRLCVAAYLLIESIRKHESRIKGDVVKVRLPFTWMVCLCREQLRDEFMQQQEKSMQKHSISISNRSCLIHWPTRLLEGCQFVKAANAQQHLLMMQYPSASQPPLHKMWSGRCLLHDMKHVEWRQQDECLGYSTQSQWAEKTKNPLVLGVISLQQWRLSSPDLDHTLCTFQDPPWITFLFEDRGGQRVLSAWVFMPQLAADVPVQRKFGPKESCCRSTCQDCTGGYILLNPESHRSSSLGLQKPSLHLPLWHDLETMSDSSLWTVLSNFNMPHFFSGARLRRSKR